MINVDENGVKEIIAAIMANAPMAAVIILAVVVFLGMLFLNRAMKKMNPVESQQAFIKLLSEQAAANAQRMQDQAREHTTQLQAVADRQAAFQETMVDRQTTVIQQNSIAFTRVSESMDRFQTFLGELPGQVERAVETGVLKASQHQSRTHARR